MKAFGITMAILTCLGMACCGGVFFLGKRGLEGGMAGLAEAQAFARVSVLAIGAKWDPKELRSRVSEGYKDEFAEADDQKLLREVSLKIGPISSVSDFELGSINLQNSVLRVQLAGRIKGSAGSGRIQIKVVRTNGVWKIDSWRVDPSGKTTVTI